MSGFLLTIPLSFIYVIFLSIKSRKENFKISSWFYIGLFVFVIYISIVLDITCPGNISDVIHQRFHPNIMWIPFIDLFKRYDKSFTIFEMVANVILFIPLGVLLPSLWQKYKSFLTTTFTGFTFSLIIKLFQLLNYRQTDITDLINNTLGTIIGYLIYILLFKRITKKIKLSNDEHLLRSYKATGTYLLVIIFMLYFFLVPFLDKLIYGF